MTTEKKTYNLDARLVKDVEAIAQAQATSNTAVIEKAIRLYRDYIYLEEKATFLPEQIQKTFRSELAMLEQRQNVKINKLLSELAIQEGIIAQILANELEVDLEMMPVYRRRAVEALRASNRVFGVNFKSTCLYSVPVENCRLTSVTVNMFFFLSKCRAPGRTGRCFNLF